MKKLFIICAFMLGLSTLLVLITSAVPSFDDATADYDAEQTYEGIHIGADAGQTQDAKPEGVEDGQTQDAESANAGEPITREAFCVMLANAALNRAGASLPADADGILAAFADADGIGSENSPYIAYLFKQGILLGSTVEGELFMKPAAPVTKQDAAAFLGRWIGLDPARGASPAVPFADEAAIAGYARGVAYQLLNLGVLYRETGGSFDPLGNISVEEASKLIAKAADISGNPLTVYYGEGNLGNEDGGALEARFAMPSGLCLDNSGNLIVFDTWNACLKKISGGKSATILGGTNQIDDYGFAMPYYRDGAAADALFGRPSDGVYAPNGDLFIVDSENHAIRLLRGGTVYTLAGGTQGHADGKEGSARFDSPSAIAMGKDGSLYVADTMNHCIRKVTPDGVVTTVAGSPGRQGALDGRGSAALFCEPSGIAVDENGIIYVADTGNHLIRKIDGAAVTTIAGTLAEPNTGEDYAPGGYKDAPAPSAAFCFPRGLCYEGGVLLIADTGNHTIRALTTGGDVITVAGNGFAGDADNPVGAGMMNKPTSVAYSNGVLYITDTLNNKIKTVVVDITTLQS